jgi:2-phospho-L-lactate guanylyltransferase
MQATVRTFSPATRSGTLLLDDGTPVPFDAAAFEAGGFRLLRSGQRVRIVLEDARVARVGLPGTPAPSTSAQAGRPG